MSFALDLKAFGDLSEKRMLAVAKKSFIDVGSMIVRKTPVDTSRARSNWIPSINTMSTEITADNKNLGLIDAEMRSEANKVKLGDTMYLTNNLSYIVPLEFGWSKMAPSGMLRTSIAQWNQTVSQNVAKSKAIKGKITWSI